MDEKKKLAGWLVLTSIALVAAVALATTNLLTEEPIARQNQSENQAALERMFPEADSFAELSPGESAGVGFVYEVRQGERLLGYAVKETTQGYGGSIEVIAGVDPSMRLKGIDVGGPDFQETEGLGSRAREEPFTAQFVGQTPPLRLGGEIDAVSGATVTSRAVTEGVNQGVGKVRALLGLGEGEAAGETSAPRTARASTIGYGGPVLVRLTLDEAGAIAALTVGGARFAETDGVGSRVREEAFARSFLGKTPPLRLKDVDAISGATVSSQAVVDAVNQAAAFLED